MVPLVAAEIGRQLDEIVVRPGGSARVLDIGCGGQPLRGDLERRGYRYFGMDLESGKICPDYLGRIDADLPASLMQARPFDLVLCTEVLEHVPDWDTAFKNLSLLMAPGGHLIITCPHFYLLHEEPWDYWRPTPYALRHFGEKNGLHVNVLKKAGDVWDVMGTLISVGRIAPQHSGLFRGIQLRLANLALAVLRKLLIRKSLSTRFLWETPFYLSNIAVFTKPAL
jgi:SAM-dependent methyltransferase